MIVLYIQPGCGICHRTKAALDEKEIVYEETNIQEPEGLDRLKNDMARLGNDLPRSMPTLVTDDLSYSGADCLVAIEEGEIS